MKPPGQMLALFILLVLFGILMYLALTTGHTQPYNHG